jgi:hypothetical protein
MISRNSARTLCMMASGLFLAQSMSPAWSRTLVEEGTYTLQVTVTGEKPGGFNIQARVEPAFSKPVATQPAGNGSNTANGGNGQQGGNGAQGNNGNSGTANNPGGANGNSGTANNPTGGGNSGSNANSGTAANPFPNSQAGNTPAGVTQEQLNTTMNTLSTKLQQQQQAIAAQIAAQLQQQQQAQQQAMQQQQAMGQQVATNVADLQRRAQAIEQMTQDMTNNRVNEIARRLRRTMNQQNTPQSDSDRVVNAIRDMLMQSAQRNQQQQQNGGGGGNQQASGSGSGSGSSGQMSDEQMQLLASKLEETLRTRLSSEVAAKVTEQLRDEMNRPVTAISVVDYDYERPFKAANALDNTQYDRKLALYQEARDICRLSLADSGRTASQKQEDRKFMMLLAGKFRQMQGDATDSDTRTALDRDISTCLSMGNEQ